MSPAAIKQSARLVRIAGPVAVAVGLDAQMYEVVLVGEQGLLGEVIQLIGDRTVIQVYEDTSGIAPGAPVQGTGTPLCVELGPGLMGSIYDGIQRPLEGLRALTGDFITRGAKLPGLDRKRKWAFTATLKEGATVSGGDVLGTVQEYPGFTHRILVPPGKAGTIRGLKSGTYTVDQPICMLTTDKGKEELRMMHTWPVRTPRPVREKHAPEEPLITGQRVIDTLFPVAKGGTAIIPGPFGAGKTVAQQQLAKWSDADAIVYIGCGERGNEMTEVLTEFPELKDPRNGNPLMHRTVLIANTSNMPVAAREASIYTGITLAEYLRDMGYHVALMADSTSRWAEALREISSRLEEMPGEEGFPAYLGSKVAEFYERAGAVTTTGGSKASLTAIGAVSPPGGDFFEPVTQSSLRVAKVFWALEAKLAQQRHFPSINWLESYSLYPTLLAPWYRSHGTPDWELFVGRISKVLQEEAELLELVQLVGMDALPEGQQLTLHVARLVREVLLQQSAFDAVDAYSSLEKSYAIMRLITRYHDACITGLKKTKLSQIIAKGMTQKLFVVKMAKEIAEPVHAAEMVIDGITKGAA